MKTERKHELETNELSDWLTTFLNDIKPYSKLITAVVVLTVVGIFLINLGAAQRRKNQALAWTDLFAIQVEANSSFDPEAKAVFVDRLVELAKREGSSPVGAWALQYAGDISLALGADQLWQDRTKANEHFQSAVTHYEEALSRADHDVLKQRALMGLAQSREAMNNFSGAESDYQSIIERWPDATVAKSAGERLAFLNQPSTREFYDWFLKQEPPKPQQPATIPDIPGVIPSSDPFSLTPPESSAVPLPTDGATSGLDLGDISSGFESTAPDRVTVEDVSIDTAGDDGDGTGKIEATESIDATGSIEATGTDP